MITTINAEIIKSFDPCEDGYKNYLKHHKDFEGTVLEFLELENIPVKDRLWLVLRKEIIPEKELHLFACWCAERVLHVFEEKHPDDDRPRKAIEAKRKWLKGEITSTELIIFRKAAYAATSASVYACADAIYAATYATYAASAASATYDAAAHAAYAYATYAASAAYDAATYDADTNNEREMQLKEVKRIIKNYKGTTVLTDKERIAQLKIANEHYKKTIKNLVKEIFEIEKISYFAKADTSRKIDAGRKIIRQGGSCSGVPCEECLIAGEKEMCLTACNSAKLEILKTMGFDQEEKEENNEIPEIIIGESK